VVSDTGPGIPKEEQEDIFKRYYQGQSSKGLPQPGYGIGLAMCKEYAQLIQGQVWVESIPGKGASFFFTFPKLIVQEQAAIAPSQPLSNRRETLPRTFASIIESDSTKHKILVAEDNPSLLELLYDILSEDYEVYMAKDGQEAFNLLKKHESAIKVVITDIMMPVMDGYSLLDRTRNHPKLGFVPFLFLSALSSDEDRMKAFRLGVDAYLAKPFETVELKVRVKNLINNQLLRQGFIENADLQDTPQAASTDLKPVEKAALASEPLRYDEAWLQELEGIVRENISRFDFKITDLAFQMHVSERTLRYRIKEYTGLTPTAYLQQVRLSLALFYVKRSKYETVSELSYAVGFKDFRYFSKLFEKTFGKRPSEYL
jgi:DNA-binding response OmpR family regulator